jgi:hypothetical protein
MGVWEDGDALGLGKVKRGTDKVVASPAGAAARAICCWHALAGRHAG